jgi:hypothetical protein
MQTRNGNGIEEASPTYQMCPIHGDFKHFQRAKIMDFPQSRKVSSIMQTNALSIMQTNPGPVRTD